MDCRVQRKFPTITSAVPPRVVNPTQRHLYIVEIVISVRETFHHSRQMQRKDHQYDALKMTPNALLSKSRIIFYEWIVWLKVTLQGNIFALKTIIFLANLYINVINQQSMNSLKPSRDKPSHIGVLIFISHWNLNDRRTVRTYLVLVHTCSQ